MSDLTLVQAADLLGIKPATLRQQLASGRIRGRKVGPLWLIKPAELERYRVASLGQPGRKARQAV